MDAGCDSATVRADQFIDRSVHSGHHTVEQHEFLVSDHRRHGGDHPVLRRKRFPDQVRAGVGQLEPLVAGVSRIRSPP